MSGCSSKVCICTRPWGKTACKHFRSCFSFHHSPLVLMSTRPICFESQISCGLFSQVLVLIVNVRYNLSLFWEKFGFCGPLWVGFMKKSCLSLSCSLQCSFPLICPLWMGWFITYSFLGKTITYIAIDLVSLWEERHSGSSYENILTLVFIINNFPLPCS